MSVAQLGNYKVPFFHVVAQIWSIMLSFTRINVQNCVSVNAGKACMCMLYVSYLALLVCIVCRFV